jgi:glycosyltransferase involved in cell wall biosynthesis
MKLENEARIKLMIITPTLECGGSEKFVSLVCEHINAAVFSVCLVVIDNSKPFYAIKNPLIEIIDLKKTRVLFSLPAIKKAVNHCKPDIIFSTANHLNLYLAIFKNRFAGNIKFAAREANIVSINSKEAKFPVLYNRLIKIFYGRFDVIICQSVCMQQDLLSHYHIGIEKTRVIYNATEAIGNTMVKPAAQNKDRTYKFITVARLSTQKGIERIIEALGLLAIPFKYYITGDGIKKEAIQKQIDNLSLQDKVFLLGARQDPFAGMEDADLFLMGSYYEGFPNVLLEAGALGIPVVAFNAPGGIAEIITDNENGLLVTDNDHKAFAAAINNALTINFDRGKIINTTKQLYSVKGMMAAMENIFLKLAPNK